MGLLEKYETNRESVTLQGEMEPWLAAADTSAQAGSYWCDTDLEGKKLLSRFRAHY
eukprot:SAG31_NODE_857_length_11448_cov_15.111287_4_plen_56_part_00